MNAGQTQLPCRRLWVSTKLKRSAIAAGIFFGLAAASLLGAPFDASDSQDALSAGFRNPPDSAKPILIWQWMNGVVSKAGITADLESFRRVGLGGVQNFQIGGPAQATADDPSVQIGNAKWRELMRFTMDECARLGLSYGAHNCPGWSSSGAPDVQAADSMQKLVWTETKITGPGHFSVPLEPPAIDPKWNYYQDIAVLAAPDQPTVARDEVVDLTGKLNAAGQLDWDVPAGNWTIWRFGHTTTGQTNNSTAPASGVGLECDKMSRAAVERFWQGYPAMLLDVAGPNAGKAFSRLEIDSYEAGPQDWTPAMRAEFQTRRGYDPLPWLPTLMKHLVVGDPEQTSRFKRDWKQTIADLFADNYYLFMDELARRTPGLQLLVEPYEGPFSTPAASGGQSLLACEFWTQPSRWGGDNVPRVASAAHTWGKPLVFAEAFTCWPLSAWQDDPYALKPTGDRAFAQGVNLLMLHAGAQNPWPNAKPGMSMGRWGTQFLPGQTWWEHGGPEWLAYLTRSQFLLQQGLPVADLCYLLEEKIGPRPDGYKGDACGEREFLTRLSVKEGRLALPDGMTYRALVWSGGTAMTPPIARKLRQLVNDGATLVGPKPVNSPSLQDYPAGDAEIKQIAEEVWGDCDGQTVKEHRFGKGRVYWGVPLPDVLEAQRVAPDAEFGNAPGIRWTHRRLDDGAEIYFVANPDDRPAEVTATFRVADRLPELWHADTGETESAPNWQKTGERTAVRLSLDPSGSVFVVFRQPASDAGPGLQKPAASEVAALNVDGPWMIHFPPNWGAPEQITLETLASWADYPNPGVKYFSGTAAYEKEVDMPANSLGAGKTVWLNLGQVKNIAEVAVNGRPCGTLWKPPFRADVTAALKPGKNRLEIRVTNLWPNRMIGDEQEPDDCEWTEPIHYSYAPGNPVIGRQLASVPPWLTANQPRPSKGRYGFVSFKFFNKDSKLLPSGLLGPVVLESVSSEKR